MISSSAEIVFGAFKPWNMTDDSNNILMIFPKWWRNVTLITARHCKPVPAPEYWNNERELAYWESHGKREARAMRASPLAGSSGRSPLESGDDAPEVESFFALRLQRMYQIRTLWQYFQQSITIRWDGVRNGRHPTTGGNIPFLIIQGTVKTHTIVLQFVYCFCCVL